MRNLIRIIFAMAVFAGIASIAAAEEGKGVVVTSEGLSERCILALVVTAVDGKELEESEQTGRFELDPGSHSFTGYGGDDPSLCATFMGENPVAIVEGDRIGEGTLELNVVAGKEYYLGIDVRSANKNNWKVVTWKIVH